MPESADAWYYLGDDLFHFGRLSDIPDPEVRARQAFEQAFQRDSLNGGPIQHLAALSWVARDTSAQRLWTRRMIALDSAGEGPATARWNLLQATRDEAGIRAFLAGLDRGPMLVPQGILFFGMLDSVTMANRNALLDAVHRLATSKADRETMALGRVNILFNVGRPAEARKWMDTLATLDPEAAGRMSLLGDYWFGGPRGDTTLMTPEERVVWHGWSPTRDAAAGQRVLALARADAAKDSVDGFSMRLLATLEASLAVDRNDPAAPRLVDVADSLWRGRDGAAAWGGLEMARLYAKQGRIDRALRAVRRRWLPLGAPEPAGLAESYRLEGHLAALADDTLGAMRAYRNYLRIRVDPEPSMVPQVDSVRAELGALGDREGKR